MLKESNNIYLPIYSVRKNAGFVSTDRDWCTEATDELASQTPEAILKDLEVSDYVFVLIYVLFYY